MSKRKTEYTNGFIERGGNEIFRARYDNYMMNARRVYQNDKEIEDEIKLKKPFLKKSNAFHVDTLLGNKYVNTLNTIDRDNERESVIFHKKHPSAFKKLKDRNNRMENSDLKYSPPPPPPPPQFSSRPLREYTVEKCNKSCCYPPVPRQNLSKYTGSIQAYRTRETGSADSIGSSCNSLETPPSVECTGKLLHRNNNMLYRDASYHEEKNIYMSKSISHSEAHLSYIYKEKTNQYPYDKKSIKEEHDNCSCPQCDVSREFLRRGYWIEKPTKILYVEPHQTPLITNANVEESTVFKPLSKRKALLHELEVKSRKISVVESSAIEAKKEVKNIEIKKEPAEEVQVLPSKIENADKNSKGEELLKIPAGPNRNRAVANLLERRRVAELNNSFERLRILIPCYGNEDRTLSKIKTLKYAFTYMSHLMKILDEQSCYGYFHSEKDFKKLSRQDPLMHKCRDHMLNRKII